MPIPLVKAIYFLYINNDTHEDLAVHKKHFRRAIHDTTTKCTVLERFKGEEVVVVGVLINQKSVRYKKLSTPV